MHVRSVSVRCDWPRGELMLLQMPKRDLVWDCTSCGKQANPDGPCERCRRERGNAALYDLIDFERTTGGRMLQPIAQEIERRPAAEPETPAPPPPPARPRRRGSLLRKSVLLLVLAATLAAFPFAIRWGGTRGKGGPWVRVGKPERGAWVMVVNKRVEDGKHVVRVRTPDHEIVDLEIERAKWQSVKKGEIRNATFSRFGGLVSIGTAQRE